MSTAVDTTAAAVEMEHVESHLHPEPTYDLQAHPLPTGREEIWRFTPLKRLRGLLQDAPSDGHLEQKLELPASVTLTAISLDEASALGGTAPFDRLGALAAKNAGGALLLDIPAEADVTEPIRVHLHGTSLDEIVWGRLVVRIGTQARATVVIEHSGSTTYDAFTTVLVGDGAQLDLVHVNDWADDAVHAEQINARVGRDATLRQFEFTLGGDLVRTSTNVDYAGPGGTAELFGLYFADAGQHFEHRLFVDHTAPKTVSNVVYKGALQGEKAHTVWIGNVLIRKVAEGIETYEENRNLVLTDGCQADSVPNLEIETGEIAGAGHASAVGRFDDEQLFYLRSRGIEEAEARKLVVRGFFDDLIRRVTVPELAAKLSSQVEEELQRHVLKELA
ncbi:MULTISPECIES: Fe-S cluster assembly protein SufD [Nocardioides]|uniref:Fe-S cluster assembly protein SufD n=1 Tax=Nocardioides vastitatis TaxID=2568655 RepID=A0ABW0ZHP2_9ACTN|nr:Fe-S cluster assembly protein SufD [Nocardioides sp.]THI98568.1 Fe-S cluster assembly protein SufD [Nocardioides sp.]